MLPQVVCLFLLLAAPLLATNLAGDPTDLANWPACAVCVPMSQELAVQDQYAKVWCSKNAYRGVSGLQRIAATLVI